jgi:hypothetical protein
MPGRNAEIIPKVLTNMNKPLIDRRSYNGIGVVDVGYIATISIRVIAIPIIRIV